MCGFPENGIPWSIFFSFIFLKSIMSISISIELNAKEMIINCKIGKVQERGHINKRKSLKRRKKSHFLNSKRNRLNKIYSTWDELELKIQGALGCFFPKLLLGGQRLFSYRGSFLLSYIPSMFFTHWLQWQLNIKKMIILNFQEQSSHFQIRFIWGKKDSFFASHWAKSFLFGMAVFWRTSY